MKSVMLIGDSIRLNYQSVVEKELADKYTVWAPVENCRFAKYTLNELKRYKVAFSKDKIEKIDEAELTPTVDETQNLIYPDIIHWNNGLWDLYHWFEDGPMTPKEFYVDTMIRIAKILLQRSKIVIFATITPVRQTHPTILNTEIIDYNQTLIPELKKLGVVINDLHTLIAADIPRYILASDHIHLTEDGVHLCSTQVANVIRKHAENL